MRQTTSSRESVSVTIENNFNELEEISRTVRSFGEEIGLNPDTIFALDLALEEILTNIIKYGYDDLARHELEIRLWVESASVVVEVRDDGHEFNPVVAPEPDTRKPAAERPIGGLGLHLIRKMVGSIEYKRLQGMNIVRLIFQRTSEEVMSTRH